ncbi:M20 family metallo-hydrolase [Polluticaenibacter yanchengensis]|uniref:M20 family metallo-hydrolase n=1 Tax=Polluticaenibacter yanchengensis TaxID=3014562 RepID=A0ABT4UKQ9_9BACT|nr:M20 family metallo-hydrolase [Chitinophagaceae bacterium LY-5]
MAIHSERLNNHIYEQSAIGKIAETGICRPAHSAEEKQVFQLAAGWMTEAGMTVKIDNFGNLIGTYPGTEPGLPVLMMGSHLDTQPYGGRFDGIAGVLGAIEVVKTLHDNNIKPKRTIQVVSFADEEGWRFNKGLYGSRGILGKLEPDEEARKDANGISRREALESFGCNLSEQSKDVYAPGSIHCFLELHIEQGPVLEALEQPVGIVSGISGPLWLTVTFKGVAGHTGSVPMHMRNDALLGAAEVIVAINKIATQEPGSPTVGTCGSLNVFPNSRNIIPEEVVFTLDLRDIEQSRRDKYEAQLRVIIEEVTEKHGLTYTISEDTNSEPRYCAQWMKDIIREESEALGVENIPELMSGPFHDSLPLSYACDYAMIFIRSKAGISHNPKEYSSPEDIALGADLLYKTVYRILQQDI